MINLNLLGHIVLDSESKARFGIEGNTFENTFRYLSNFLESATGQEAIPEGELASISHLRDMLSQLVGVDDTLRSEHLESISSQLIEKIQQLSPEQSLLLPGGWQGDPGHAMIYEFKKDAEGHLLFHIYNSGAGTEYHQKITLADKEAFVAQKTYQLPDVIHAQELKNFIEILLANKISGNPKRISAKIDEEKLYNFISSQMIMLNAQEKHLLITPEAIEKATTAGQLSGTCSQRSIHQMLKLHFKEPKNYQIFIFKFQMHALEEYLESPPERYSPLIAKFLKKALVRNTRHLKNLQKEGWIESEKLDEFKEKLLMMGERIEQKTHPEIIQRPPSTAQSAKNRYIRPQVRIYPRLQSSRAYQLRDFPILDIMTEDFVSFEKLQRTLVDIQDNGQNSTYKLHQLHELIYKLPLNIESYPIENDKSMLIQIKHIMDNYQRVYQSHYRDSITPEYITSMLSLLTIYINILKRSTTDEPAMTSQIDYLKTYVQYFLKKIKNSALNASFDPKTDEKLTALIRMYPHGELRYLEPTLIEFYKEIFIDSNLDAWSQQLYESKPTQYSEARDHGLLNLEFIKEQFLSLNTTITFTYLNNLEEIQTWGLRNCFVKIRSKSYWIPAFGEPEEFTPYDSYFSMRYRILKTDSPLLQEDFKDVFLQFQRQLDLETSIYRCFEPLLTSISAIYPRERNEKLRSDLFAYDTIFKGFKETGPISTRRGFKCDYKFIANTYAIHDPNFNISLIESSFLFDTFFRSKDSNLVQVSHLDNGSTSGLEYRLPDTKSLTFEQILLYRELTHLRTNLDTCASLSLRYFSEHLEKLSQPDIQNYLEINLFQDVTKVNFEQLEAFIQDALKFHQENGINTQTSIYCICLKAKLCDYINHPNTLNWIETNLDLEDKPEFKALLHAQRFKTLMAKKDRTPEEQEKIYDSYLWLKNKYIPRTNQTLIERSQLEDAMLTYQVQDKGLSPEQMLRLSLSHLGIDAALFEIQPHEQNFILIPQQGEQEPLILDIHKGQLFSEQGIYKPIPILLSKHPLIKELGLEPSCSAFQNESGTEFHIMNPPTRFLLDINNQVICQKKIGDIWYTKVDINTVEDRDLPQILTDADCQLWYDTISQTSLLFRKNIKIFDIHSSGELIGLEETPENYYDFESQGFIFTKEKTVYLTRYGFSITDGHIDDSRLGIMENQHLLPENTAQLYCRDEVSGQEFCRVPIHAFYFDENQTELEGALPTLTHDISNTIITKILEQEDKKPIARYENTCEFYQYPIIDGQIQPENAEMALYLCYIHLVNRDYDKANAILKTIDKIGFSGTEKELQFLDWILNKIPYPLPSQKNDAAENPEEVACQLKALSLYTQFINEGMKPQLGKLISNPNEKQAIFKSIIQKDAQSVYTELANKVAQKIHDYQTRLRHTPIQFQLTDAELLSMTRYLNSQWPTLDGSLSYLHQSLQLKQIQQQIKHLQALPQSPKNQEKLEKLQEKLTQHVLVRQRISEFETLEITNNLTADQLQKIDSFRDSFREYNKWRYDDLLTIDCDKDKAMRELNSRMGIHALIRNFPAYAQIAYDEKNPYYRELREFLTRYIRSQYHTPLEKQPDAFLAWCLFLYRVSDPCRDVQRYKNFYRSSLEVSDFFSKD